MFGLAACGGSSSSTSSSASSASVSASSSSDDLAKAEYDRACALYDEGKYYSAKEAFEKSAYEDWEQRAAACVQSMPETGELFHDPDMTSDNMILNFIVNEDDASKGIYISVYTKDKKLAETLFVKGGGTIETRLPGGEYYVKDSSGAEWYGEDEQFGPNGHYESMVFNTVEGDPYLTALEEGYQWDITINDANGTGQGVGSEEGSWDNR
jgi:hypothetical protein